MQFSEFITHLEMAPCAPVYLFTGEAELLMEDAWKRLVEKFVPIKARHFNGERLSANEVSAGQVLERLNTIPMFGKKQLVMVQRVEAWPKEQRSILAAYLDRPTPTACLVLTASVKKGLEKIEEAVNSVGVVVQFFAPTERDAPRWIQNRVRIHKKLITSGAAVFMVEQVGADLHLLDLELNKLSAYVGDREKIELEDVRQVVGSQRSFSVFELLRFVSQGERARAVTSLRELMLTGEPPLAVLALLARQVRILWQVMDGTGRGLSPSDMGRQLNLPASVVKNYDRQSRSFSEYDLFRIHQAICQTDVALKSTGVGAEMIMEALVLTLSQRTKKSP